MASTTSSQQAQRTGPNRSLARLIATALLALIVLVGVAVLIIWLIIRPKRLVFSVEEDGSVHGFNLSHNRLDASFDFVVRSYNPNRRVSVYYDSMEASAVYKDRTVAFGPVEPFFQPRRNVTRLEVKLAARDVALVGPAYRDLRLERSSGGVGVDVALRARIRFKVGLWKSGHRTLRIYCSPVLVHFSRAKSFERTYCDVEL